MSSEEAEKYKAEGNEAFKEKRFDDAIKAYNKAITLDPTNAAYYSNRSGAWSSKGNHDSALADANRCISNDPKFIKGYARKGKAYFDLNQWDEAEAAYKEGLHVDPNSDACSRGILDITAARQRAKSAASSSQGSRSSSGGGGGGGGSSGGGFAGLVQQVAEKFKKGGRMQMYLVMMVGYFLFTNLTGRGSKRSTAASDEQGTMTDDDDIAPEVPTAVTSRKFTQFGETWLSNLQTDTKTDTVLLFFHRTASSAEAEYGAALPRITKILPPRSVSILAPDRPCHGYSTCSADGEPEDPMKWVNRLLGAQKLMRPKRLVLVSAGRDSARLALSLARSKPEVTQLLLMSPRIAAPRRVSMTSAAEVHTWLSEHSSLSTAQAAADAARWAAAGGKEGSSEPKDLDVTKLPQDCKVSILYGEEDEEDEELRTALESAGIEPKVRHPAGDDDLLAILADEVRQSLAPEATGVEMED